MMALSPDQRKQNMIGYEGQILSMAGNCGVDNASEHAKCLIDGAMNGLIRIAGPEQASLYAYALADRAARGVREWTVLPIIKSDAVGALALPPPEPVAAPPEPASEPELVAVVAEVAPTRAQLRAVVAAVLVLIAAGFAVGVVVAAAFR